MPKMHSVATYCPILNVTAFVDQVAGVSPSLRKGRGVNEELVADKKRDSDFGGVWHFVLTLFHFCL
jgi:hypothetical protein